MEVRSRSSALSLCTTRTLGITPVPARVLSAYWFGWGMGGMGVERVKADLERILPQVAGLGDGVGDEAVRAECRVVAAALVRDSAE